MVHCPSDLRYPNCKTGYTVSKANYIVKACALKILQFINDSMKTTNKNFNNHIDNNGSCYCNLYNLGFNSELCQYILMAKERP